MILGTHLVRLEQNLEHFHTTDPKTHYVFILPMKTGIQDVHPSSGTQKNETKMNIMITS